MRRFLSLLLTLAMIFAGACGNDWRQEYVALQAELTAESDSTRQSEVLEQMAAAPFVPTRERDAARPYRQDAYYRLARRTQDATEQLRLADAGLALGGEDLFVANLLAIKGRALEALGRDDEAPAVYHRALLINEELLNNLLDEMEPK